MWDDEKHHTVYREEMGIPTYSVYGITGRLERTVVPEDESQRRYYAERLEDGACFICDDLEQEYAIAG